VSDLWGDAELLPVGGDAMLLALERYLALMMLNLQLNFPMHNFRMKGQTGRQAFDAGWVMKSTLVTAWLTAGPALEVN